MVGPKGCGSSTLIALVVVIVTPTLARDTYIREDGIDSHERANESAIVPGINQVGFRLSLLLFEMPSRVLRREMFSHDMGTATWLGVI